MYALLYRVVNLLAEILYRLIRGMELSRVDWRVYI